MKNPVSFSLPLFPRPLRGDQAKQQRNYPDFIQYTFKSQKGTLSMGKGSQGFSAVFGEKAGRASA